MRMSSLILETEMAVLKHQGTAPPGGFKYKQLETGLTMTGDSLQDLVAKVASHRRYKGLKPDGEEMIALEVQRQICTRLGKEDCKEETGGDKWVPVPVMPRFTLQDFLAFSRTMLEFIKVGGAIVPIDEAQRRRAICVACPLNQRATGCKCSVFYKAVEAAVPKERRWDDLHVCQLCSCSLQAKVQVPMDVLIADRRKIDWPVHCWMKDI